MVDISTYHLSSSLPKLHPLLRQPGLYQYLVENTRDLIVAMDLDSHIIHINPAIQSILGYGENDVIHRHNDQSSGSNAQTQVLMPFLQQALERVTNDNATKTLVTSEEKCCIHAQGHHIYLEVDTLPIHDENTHLIGILCICRDITQRKNLEQKRLLTAKMFEHSITGAYIADVQGRVVQVNQAFCHITGYSKNEVNGHSIQSLLKASHLETLREKIATGAALQSDHWSGEVRYSHKDARIFPAWVNTNILRDNQHRPAYIAVTFTDITAKKNSDTKIQQLAYFDPLTDLPNRTLFYDRLDQVISRAKRYQHKVGVLSLDINRFKSINDSLGYSAGDELLRQVAIKLRQCLRNEDTVARLDSDNFAIILAGLADTPTAISAAAHVAEKIHYELTQPFKIDGQTINTSICSGIAFYPSDTAKSRSLLQKADTALHQAKQSAQQGYQFYTQAMNASALARLEMENALHKAIQKAEFVLHFQPILSAIDGGAVAVEALVRWLHCEKGILMPNQFIDVAEQSGLIKPIGTWVLRQACEQFVTWQQKGFLIGRMSINISTRQFCEGYILQHLREVIRCTGIAPQSLMLELPENALMQDKSYSLEALKAIRDLGVHISIDDFGKGYSSLTQLKQYPIDTLKIDRSFIQGLPALEDARAIEGMVALAKSLGIKVIASGIETPKQLEFVQDLGCEEVQGFMLSKPLPAEKLSFLR